MNYQELRAQIERESGNTSTEFIQSINSFITRTESQIGMLVAIPNYTQTTPLVTVANVQTVSLASVPNFISVNDLVVPSYGNLEQKDTSFIDEAYPDGSETGPPRYFAMQNNVLLKIGPKPDAVYTINMEFLGKWPSLVILGTTLATQKQETFISQYFEGALFNGCMKYASMWMKDKEAASMYNTEMLVNLGLIDKFGRGKARKPKDEDTNAANDAGDNQ